MLHTTIGLFMGLVLAAPFNDPTDPESWVRDDVIPPACSTKATADAPFGCEWWYRIQSISMDTTPVQLAMQPKLYILPGLWEAGICPPLPAFNTAGNVSTGIDPSWGKTPEDACQYQFHEGAEFANVYARTAWGVTGCDHVYAWFTPLRHFKREVDRPWTWLVAHVFMDNCTDPTSARHICLNGQDCFNKTDVSQSIDKVSGLMVPEVTLYWPLHDAGPSLIPGRPADADDNSDLHMAIIDYDHMPDNAKQAANWHGWANENWISDVSWLKAIEAIVTKPGSNDTFPSKFSDPRKGIAN